MGHLQSQEPLDLVCIDFLCLEPDIGGRNSILAVTDHFLRYAQAYPTKDQKASTVAKVLVEKFFVHYGLPVQIHLDQGRDFESRLVHQLCALWVSRNPEPCLITLKVILSLNILIELY